MTSTVAKAACHTIVIVGTGGTIAGVSDPGSPGGAAGHVGYRAGVLGVDELVAAVPALRGRPLEAVTLARLDSRDMDHATWVALRDRVAQALARPEVAGVVVTHGTDTLEETAYFLHRTLALSKPVVFTAAMRPATAPSPDGPQNLIDAVTVAGAGFAGVAAVLGGEVIAGAELRKLHGYRVAAFGSGDGGPLAMVQNGEIRAFRAWPAAAPHRADPAALPVEHWPVVDIVTSHAGARGATLDALVAAGAQGIVIAGTGNGSIHRELRAAADRAAQASVRVVRASRCLAGGVVGAPDGELPSYGALTPAQARIELMLDLMAG